MLSLVCLLMGGVTSYARSRGETLGFDVKVGIAERADRLVAILVMTGLSAIFDLPVLLYIALWALAIASTVTVVPAGVGGPEAGAGGGSTTLSP